MKKTPLHIQHPAFLSARHLFWLNLVFWLILALIDGFQGYMFARNNGETYLFPQRPAFVLAYFFSFWVLSFLLYRLFVRIHAIPWRKALYILLPMSLLVGLVHLLISIGGNMLLVRLWYALHPALDNPYSRPFGEALRINLENWYPMMFNGFLIFWMVMAILYGLNFYARYRRQQTHALELASQLSQAQLQSLRMQLRPHFLFNALNTIAMMIRRQKGAEAVEMISGLSDLLRASLQQEGRQLVSLEEELAFLKKYLQIESIRFQDQLHISWQIEEQSRLAKVPALLLQPIVENAFKHGISRHLGKASLHIESRMQQSSLHLLVANTGPPLPEGWNLQQHAKIGLSNTLSRLKELYEEAFEFSLHNREAGGVAVRLSIPQTK
ncbi:MAG: hypothetical protein D6730_01240 [Bacteroidetes bacterium]|nr:MAG: hypothetical protein D6730_01240 [Bacteroidota bacterium]